MVASESKRSDEPLTTKMANETQDAILTTISRIPKGKVCTYGVIAKLAGAHGKARYVGHLLKKLPTDSSIPWHRVVNAQGKSSFPETSQKHQEQLKLLSEEGITIRNHRIQLTHYLWQGE